MTRRGDARPAEPRLPRDPSPKFKDEALLPVALARLRQPEAPPLRDVHRATVAALERSRRLPDLPAGARVAITCGSRGIQGKPAVVKSVVAWLRERGVQPFIVPAMGSHGAGELLSDPQPLRFDKAGRLLTRCPD